MMVNNQSANLEQSLVAVNKVLYSLKQNLSGDEQEKMNSTLTRLLEEHNQSPQLTLIQIMKIHQRSRKDKEKQSSTTLYNLLLISRFYFEQSDIGRLLFALLDVGDVLASRSQSDTAILVFETVFRLSHLLDPKPWVRELHAIALLLIISNTLPEGNVRATKEILRSLLNPLNPSQIDRLHREDVYKITRSLIDTLRTRDQIHLHQLRKRQTRSPKWKSIRTLESTPQISLQDILEDLKSTYRTIDTAYKFLRNL